MKKISQDILGKRQDVAGSSFSLLCKSGSHELAHIFALGMSKKTFEKTQITLLQLMLFRKDHDHTRL